MIWNTKATAWVRVLMLGVLMLGLPGLLAIAADVTQEVSQLGAAVDARLNVATGKEKKKLRGVRKRIAKSDSPASVKDQTKMLIGVYQSKTEDTPVVEQAHDLLNCVAEAVGTQKAAAEELAEQLSGKSLKKLEKALARALKTYDLAVADQEGDPGRASKLFGKAYSAYAAAEKKGLRALEKAGSGGGVKIPKGNQVVATIKGPGGTEKVTGSSLFSIEFNTALLQGCKTAGGSDNCDKVVFLNFFYPDDSRETGQRNGMSISFEDFSSTPVRYFDGFNVTVNITKSTGSVIEGTFSGTMESFDVPPEVVTIEGAFRARR